MRVAAAAEKEETTKEKEGELTMVERDRERERLRSARSREEDGNHKMGMMARAAERENVNLGRERGVRKMRIVAAAADEKFFTLFFSVDPLFFCSYLKLVLAKIDQAKASNSSRLQCRSVDS
jgi:hypothetical protein